MLVKFAKNSIGRNRFGFIIPAKVFAKAVDRNRFKRILSEAVRKDLGDTLDGHDIVVLIKKKEEEEKIKNECVILLKFINT